jgi:hypothetical protein
VDAPLFDQYLGFAQGVKQFTIQQFIPEPGIETFSVAILPRDPGSM